MGGWRKTSEVSKVKEYKIIVDCYMGTLHLSTIFILDFFINESCYVQFNNDLIALYCYALPMNT